MSSKPYRATAHRLGTAFLALCVATTAQAASPLPLSGPLPMARPVPPATPGLDPMRFGSVAASDLPTPLFRAAAQPGPAATIPAVQSYAAPSAPPLAASSLTASLASLAAGQSRVAPRNGTLKQGLQALSDRKPDLARAIRYGMRPGTLDRKILAWAIASTGGDEVPAGEIAETARDLANWPGMDELAERSEASLLENAYPARSVAVIFEGHAPRTDEGAVALAEARLALGDRARAGDLVRTLWRTKTLNRKLEQRILSEFGGLLSQADHRRRMDMLLYEEWPDAAGRVAERAGAQRLYAARAAVIRNTSDQAAKLSAVPQGDRADPGYRLAMVEYYRKNDRVRDAAKLLLDAPASDDALVNPDTWWNERRIVVRDLLDLDEPDLAYRVAAGHSASGDVALAEAAFHAGWIALRWLNDPSRAAGHFGQIVRVSQQPISLARGYYWLGRAAEAGGPGDARGYYDAAARYDATYYGQLASVKLGRVPGPFHFPNATDVERQRFAGREVVQAIRRLEEIGSDWRTPPLYRGLAEELESPGELALLSVMAERRRNYHLALQVGKRAFWRGVPAPALAFPTGVIPASANISASGKALAYAIARQESAFNPSARSGAGALGLLQLLPGTARDMARHVGLSYSTSRLTSDPGYNATLGAAYLGEQIAEFGGSYVLTFAGYNAGPRRAKQWIERFGDPRGLSLDQVVDWVERIPYTETRHYVQRVMENYQVYKIRLGAGFDIVNDLRFGRRADG